MTVACAEPACIAVVPNTGDECPIHRDICACGFHQRAHPIVHFDDETGVRQVCGSFHKWDGEFVSYRQWVNKAQSWLADSRGWAVECVDSKGRRCLIGRDFQRARDEQAFPVRYRFRAPQ